ncbi:patatin-like phospholipase family protein [Variovorax sp. KK3]|uniref:patatin-like phospholipase family protein n=1 Tax=Variovorax sp. KK3 TaxID=1855728 RepID=UPI00097C774F|nr:patatin-like phospholipase family protein [Variovorax sp. KK3]
MTPIDNEVVRRRKQLDDPRIPADASRQWGLALSGGGIRSATFCFGLLRALAHRKSLLRFDLLSTVSGGGYIGTAVGSLLNRATNRAEAEAVVEALDGQLASPAAPRHGPNAEQTSSWFLWWLRANGRYLIPRGAKDTTFAVALYLRNLLAIHFELGLLAMLLGLLLCIVDLGAWQGLETLGYLYSSRGLFDILRLVPGNGWFATVWVGMPFALLACARHLAAYWAVPWVQVAGTSLRRLSRIVLALGVLLIVAFSLLGDNGSEYGDTVRTVAWWSCGLLIVVWAWGTSLADAEMRRADKTHGPALQADTARNVLTKKLANRLRVVALLLLAGFVDRLAWYLAFTGVSLVTSGLSLGVAAALLRTVLPTLSNLSSSAGGNSGALLRWVGRLLGYLLTFLLCTWWVSLVYQAVLGSMFGGETLQYDDAGQVLVLIAIPVVAYLWWTGRNFAFLNLSSLHSFYRARLVRSYMGAANGKRFGQADPLGALKPIDTVMPTNSPTASIDDVWPDDDLSLADYQPQRGGGPVHLFGVCVNQTTDPRGGIFNQDRRGLNLTMASGGLMQVGQEAWQPLPIAASMSVGRWMAISGAAVSSGMGRGTLGGLSALLTFAGVRLGYWWSYAERTAAATTKSPPFAKTKGLVDEIFGRFKGTTGQDWYLTDGGHFDNTAAYSLLAQRAEVIVLADCGADPDYRFEDLENLVRLARVDLQADIQFLRPRSSAGKPAGTGGSAKGLKSLDQFGSINDLALADSSACLALAKVKYGGQKPGQGILILIKPNICAGLPVDLLNFKGQNPSFPQQTTADQFFSEAQWESYFLLGQYLGSHLDQKLIETLVADCDDFFEYDDCKPGKAAGQKAKESEKGAPASRLPSRFGGSAVTASLGLGAAATLGVSAWQAIDSVRTSYGKQVEAERAALKELADLWANVPVRVANEPATTSTPIDKLASALVRTADTLCPSGEADWFTRSPVATHVFQYAVERCTALPLAMRGDACNLLLSATDPELKSRLPNCLAAAETKRASFPPPQYWAYDYSATRSIDFWHPCDPLVRSLARAEKTFTERGNKVSSPQSTALYRGRIPSGELQRCHIPAAEYAQEENVTVLQPISFKRLWLGVKSVWSDPKAWVLSWFGMHAGTVTVASTAPPRPPADGAAPPPPPPPPPQTQAPSPPPSPDTCKDVRVFVQVYGPGQVPTARGYQQKWQQQLGARPLPVEDVDQTARARGRPEPQAIRRTTVRFHDLDAKACADALAPAVGETWRVEPLSARLKAAPRTLEVWIASPLPAAAPSAAPPPPVAPASTPAPPS